MTKEELVKKWINDMIKHGFMQGWMGDKSDKFKQEQYNTMMKVLDGDVDIIGGNYRLLATIYSDYSNLKQYCSWSETHLKQLINLFRFSEIKEVIAMMNCDAKEINKYMDKARLREDVVLY